MNAACFIVNFRQKTALGVKSLDGIISTNVLSVNENIWDRSLTSHFEQFVLNSRTIIGLVKLSVSIAKF